ncbi:MAG TPA: hypothetical protein VD788_15620 [Candidatus Polarisedimenticolaceae bacterium]|nr:hypothetical protein [Candidatus Polarisedimenticolaceae bacterium]
MERTNLRRAVPVAVLVAALATVACAPTERSCSQCGREECKNLAFSVVSPGHVERTCCPRCGLRYLRETEPRVTRLEVRSFDDGAALDARTAFYVEASDVHPCAHPAGSTPPVDERGCCLKAVYDRCEPSLVAFATRRDAERFAGEHGGFVRSWSDLETAVR